MSGKPPRPEPSPAPHAGGGAFVVYTDCRITRRKRYHLIIDQADEVVFRSAYWSDVIDWLTDRDVSSFRLSDGEHSWSIGIVPISQPEDRAKWQKLQPPY